MISGEYMQTSNSRDEIDRLLNAIHWAKILSKETVETIKICIFSPREYIFREGEECTLLYLYAEGKSKVFKRLENGQTMLIRFLRSYQLMGDVELFLDSPAISSVQAITEVVCLGIPMKTMKEEAQRNSTILFKLGEALAKKLKTFNITSAINQNYPLETRLASYLRVIYPGSRTEDDIEELETENLEEMAEFLGCSYRHLTRTIRMLVDKGIIEKKRKSIKILDSSRLNEISRELYV
jgi:CRP/FNR family putative post-exponential-phase nitrogen-starvation transcriptional regulator